MMISVNNFTDKMLAPGLLEQILDRKVPGSLLLRVDFPQQKIYITN